MFYPVVFSPVFYQVRTRVGFGVFGMGSARVRRTVRGVGPPARGDMGTSQKSGSVWTFFMGFASVIAPSPAPLPVSNGRQLSNTRFFYPFYFQGLIPVRC